MMSKFGFRGVLDLFVVETILFWQASRHLKVLLYRHQLLIIHIYLKKFTVMASGGSTINRDEKYKKLHTIVLLQLSKLGV